MLVSSTSDVWILNCVSLQYKKGMDRIFFVIVQELCESRGGRPELSVLTSLLASVDVKIY